MLNHWLLDSDTGSPKRYHMSPWSQGGHDEVQDAQPKMPAGFGIWPLTGTHLKAGRQEGIMMSGFGKGFCRETCCRRIARDQSQRNILDTVWKTGLKGSCRIRGLGELPVTPELGVSSLTTKGWKDTGYGGFPSLPALAIPPPDCYLPRISCASFISHSFSHKKKKTKPKILCMEEPCLRAEQAVALLASCGLQMCWQKAGCSHSPHLLTVMKTGGAACSDGSFPCIKHGHNAARRHAGSWQLVGTRSRRCCPVGRGRKPSKWRERQVCRGKGEEIRDLGQYEAVDANSCI